jgi:hypothetical protein
VCLVRRGGPRLDRKGFLQQRFEHEEACLVEVLTRHVVEGIRLKLGLGLIQRHLLQVELSQADDLRAANLLVTGWIDRLLAGEDISLPS